MYSYPAGSTLPDHTLLWKIVFHVESECDQRLDTVVIMPSETGEKDRKFAMNLTETPEDFTFVVGRNLSQATATFVGVETTECAATVSSTLYYNAINTTELHSVKHASTAINGSLVQDMSLPMENVYATKVVLTLTSDCASGVEGYLLEGEGEPFFFKNLSTETPTYTVVVDRLAEDQLLERVGLWNNTCVSAPDEPVWMELVGYYYNFSREITPTAQPPTTPVPETMSPEDGSSGLAKGVVVVIVVSCLVVVAGAAGVYFYRKKVSERNGEGEGIVQTQ